jgi:hypothetical protein
MNFRVAGAKPTRTNERVGGHSSKPPASVAKRAAGARAQKEQTVKQTKLKPHLDGKVVSNDGDAAVVQYKDGESRVFERFLGQEEWKGFQEAKPAATPQAFLKELPVGRAVRLDWRPEKMYAMSAEGPNRTTKKMTVGDLIRELQAFPPDSLALISSDEEGNNYKLLYNVIGGTFGEDEDHAKDDRFEDHDLKVGDPYAIIWPHG